MSIGIINGRNWIFRVLPNTGSPDGETIAGIGVWGGRAGNGAPPLRRRAVRLQFVKRPAAYGPVFFRAHGGKAKIPEADCFWTTPQQQT